MSGTGDVGSGYGRRRSSIRTGRWHLALLVGAGITSILLASCSSSPSASTSTTTTSASTTTSGGNASTTTTAAAGPVYQVRTGTVKGLGSVLVDGKGMTLYLFVPDKQLATSTCYGACAQAWPPLLLPVGGDLPARRPGSAIVAPGHHAP